MTMAMGKRKQKQAKGVYKRELRNEPLKFEVSQSERELLNVRVAQSSLKQSVYLRNLLLLDSSIQMAPDKAASRRETNKSLTETIVNLGRRLNQVAKKLNTNLMADETLAIDSDEAPLIAEIDGILELVEQRVEQICEAVNQTRDIQVKFLVTKTELETIKHRLKNQNVTLSRYLREQITGYDEREHKTKAKVKEFKSQLGKLNNNVEQIIDAISQEKKQHRLVIIEPEVELQLSHVRETLNRLKNELSKK